MRFFAAISYTLAGTCAFASAISSPEAKRDTDDASLVLTFRPKEGKGPELLTLFKDSAQYIVDHQAGVLSAYGFKVSGKEEYVFVERYETKEDMIAWAKTDVHTQMVTKLIPLIDIFGSSTRSSISLFELIGDLLG